MLYDQGWRRIKIIGTEYMSVLDVENPRTGNAVQCRPGVNSVIRLPRNESLRILPKSGMSKMYDALVSCELLTRTPLQREFLVMACLEADQCIAPLVCKYPGSVVYWSGVPNMHPFLMNIGGP